jgi:hypothetical protein
VANTAANRRFTFGRRGREGLLSHHLRGLLVFGLCPILTSGSLALLAALAPGAPATVELAVLVAANLLATALRYAAMRLWIFGPAQRGCPLSGYPGQRTTTAREPGPRTTTGGVRKGELQGLPTWRARPNPSSRG